MKLMPLQSQNKLTPFRASFRIVRLQHFDSVKLVSWWNAKHHHVSKCRSKLHLSWSPYIWLYLHVLSLIILLLGVSVYV